MWVPRSLQWRCGSAVAHCRAGGTECSSASWDFWRRSPLSSSPPPYLASGQTTGREHSFAHQQKIGLKIYWAWPRPSDQTQFSPQSLPSGSFHKPLILIHQRADRMKTSITESYSNWSQGPQPCLTQWDREPCHVGPPKKDGSLWRVLAKHGQLEKGMVSHFSVLALRTPWIVWKGKKIGHWTMNSPG